MENIRIVGGQTVKPAAGEAAHKGSLDMAPWDRIFGVVHVMTVLFYKPSQNCRLVDSLRESLSRALVHFCPFAGRLRQVKEDAQRLEIDCNSMGAVLVEAECDEELGYFLDLPSEKLKGLVPAVDYHVPVHEVPLLLVQLTRLRCGGVALGLAWAHAIADGVSAFHFFQEWARLTRGESLKEAPYLDRTILSTRLSDVGRQQLNNFSESDHAEFSALPGMLGKKDSSDERKKMTVNMVLPLTKTQLDMLKKSANGDEASSRYSRYQVVAAHIWRCASKARQHNDKQATTISIATDVRNRIRNSPMPPRYLGNALLIMRAASEAGELISNPLGFVCGLIKEAISKVDEDYIWSNIESLEKKKDLSFCTQDIRVSNTSDGATPFYGNPNIGVVSWLTMGVYDLDFGWGDTVRVRPITRDLDGHMIMMPGPNHDGTIAVEVCLQGDHADRFKKYFYEDIHGCA